MSIEVNASGDRKQEILEDLATDREEFYSETNKDDLLQTLKDEYHQSPKAKWTLLQSLITTGLFTVHQHLGETTSPDDHVISDPANHRQHLGTPPSQRKNRTVITVKSDTNGHNLDRTEEDRIPAKVPSKVKFFSGYAPYP